MVFDDVLTAGAVPPESVLTPRVLRRLRVRIPPDPVRLTQRVAMKRGRLDPERALLRAEGVRRIALGEAAAASPRFLVRVDEFPHWQAGEEPGRFGSEAFARFHAVMAAHDTPYLAAIVPAPARRPGDPDDSRRRELDEREREMLACLGRDGVAFGMHGLDHRTRDTHPRRQGELLGLDDAALAGRLDAGLERLARHGVAPRVLVPPWNRFGAAQWPTMAARFDVITGGPETVRLLGLQAGPAWHGDAVYLPSYEPYYGAAGDVAEPARAAIRRRAGVWIPIVLHWGWEREDDFESLRRLLDVIAPFTARWEDLLAAADRSLRATRLAGHAGTPRRRRAAA